jgi:ATP-dependent RNA helicase DeaD
MCWIVYFYRDPMADNRRQPKQQSAAPDGEQHKTPRKTKGTFRRSVRKGAENRGESYVDRFRWDFVEEAESNNSSGNRSADKAENETVRSSGRTRPARKKRPSSPIPAAAVSPLPPNVIEDDDDDLNLPSYGRTAMKADLKGEPVVFAPKAGQSSRSAKFSGKSNVREPRKNNNQQNNQRKTAPPEDNAVPRNAEPRSAPPVNSLPPAIKMSARTAAPNSLHREQVVWDPERLEYVPLIKNTAAKEPVKTSAKEPPKPTGKGQDSPPESGAVPGKRPLRKTLRNTPVRNVPARELEKPVLKARDSGTGETAADSFNETNRRKPKAAVAVPVQTVPQNRDEHQHHREQRPKPQPAPRPALKERSEAIDPIDTGIVPEHRRFDPADIEAEANGFAALGVSDAMLEALKVVRYLEPTPIQAGVFQKVREGGDLMGQAQTGTGKTAAFCIPIIEGIESCPPGNDPVAMILVPTRELAVQVRDEAVRLSYGRDIRITACYGGKPLGKQIERLRNGIDVIVGTPGRILDLMRRGFLTLDFLRWVVLDEADRMLDIGFRPDIEKILKKTSPERQTLLFSATLPPPVVRLAERYMKSPEVLDFSNKNVAVETIEQFYVTVDPERKFEALVHLLREQEPQQAIIFTRTKRGADRLARHLSKKFENLAAIHGDLPQGERDTVMTRVRNGKIRYLVATDVVGRGIDVSGISHIINYDIPQFCDDYIHRVGRTGRMGREGVAYTFVTVQEGSELTRIEMRIDKLLKRTELKGFESFTKPHDPNVTLEGETEAVPAETKPVFSKRVRRVRNAL